MKYRYTKFTGDVLDGTIVTPWDKDWVKAALKASHDHVLTRGERDELLEEQRLLGGDARGVAFLRGGEDPRLAALGD